MQEGWDEASTQCQTLRRPWLSSATNSLHCCHARSGADRPHGRPATEKRSHSSGRIAHSKADIHPGPNAGPHAYSHPCAHTVTYTDT